MSRYGGRLKMDNKFIIKQFNKDLDALLDENRSVDLENLEDNEMLKFAQRLKSLDFSNESSIKASLKKKMLLLMDEKKKQKKSYKKELEEDELSVDELDYVAGGVSNKGAEFNLNKLKVFNDGDKDN